MGGFMKNVISIKNTIGIREYMNYYLNVPYLENARLTHRKMDQYLQDKHYRTPTRISFTNITEEDFLVGKYLLVRKETVHGKMRKNSFKKVRILVYENPLYQNLDLLLERLSYEKTCSIPLCGKDIKVYSKDTFLYQKGK